VGTNKKDALVDYNSFQASKNLMMCRTEIEQYCMEDVEILSDTFDIFRGVKAVTVSGYWQKPLTVTALAVFKFH
jgi:hypothetical protein